MFGYFNVYLIETLFDIVPRHPSVPFNLFMCILKLVLSETKWSNTFYVCFEFKNEVKNV